MGRDLALNLEVKVGYGRAIFFCFCALAALRVRLVDQARSRFGICAAAVDEERRRCLGLREQEAIKSFACYGQLGDEHGRQSERRVLVATHRLHSGEGHERWSRQSSKSNAASYGL
jgi:hypothetical protein